jgi:hypothetical protein
MHKYEPEVETDSPKPKPKPKKKARTRLIIYGTLLSVLAITGLAVFGLYKVNQFFNKYEFKFQNPIKIETPIWIEPRISKSKPVIKEAHAQGVEVVSEAAIVSAPAVPVKPQTSVESNYALFDQLTGGRYQILKRIGECESGFQMIPNRTGASSAYGIFQILKVHDARAVKMGVSRFTAEGNIRLAMALFDEQGTTPWDASKHCWGNN